MSDFSVPTSPTSLVSLQASTPTWFDWAVSFPCESKYAVVNDCRIHFLYWAGKELPADAPGLLFVHGGGAHANWWRFVAPFFAQQFRVAAIDLSGMGDSDRRDAYTASLRAKEMLAVITEGLGEQNFVVGHSFGGFMTMRFGVDYGDSIAGAIIADTPVRSPDDPPPGRDKRIFNIVRTYPTYEEAVSRFRLLPAQECENDFIVEFIARHSLRKVEDGWVWKFHPAAMGADRWKEPFQEHMQNMRCRTAYIHGESSALVGKKQLAYVRGLVGPGAPIVEVPQAAHHLMLDQPLAFVATVRAILESWMRAS